MGIGIKVRGNWDKVVEGKDMGIFVGLVNEG